MAATKNQERLAKFSEYSQKFKENTQQIFKGGFFSKFLLACFWIVMVQKFYQKTGMLVIYDLSTIIHIFGFWLFLALVLNVIYQPIINAIKGLIETISRL